MFQSGNYYNGVPNYNACGKNCYIVYPQDMRAVRYPDGSIQYQIVSLVAPVACENCVIIQPYPNIPSVPIVEYCNYQQQIAMKQLELKMLETQLQEEAIRHSPPYRLAFNNDAATSTTDIIHYTQSWQNNYNTMLKANAYAQLKKPCLSDMQVDQSYTTECLKLMQNNSSMNPKEKVPVRVQFSDSVTIFYNCQKSDCSLDSVSEDLKMDLICEKVDGAYECSPSTSNSIIDK